MADEVKAPVNVEAGSASEESTRLTEGHPDAAIAENSAGSGDTDTATGAADAAKAASGKDDVAAGDTTANTTADDANSNANNKDVGSETGAATDTAVANGTPASSKKAATTNGRRKSGAGIPEHKKKTPSKKKAAVEIRLNVQPGEMFFVAMRGFPPWPVIVTDEEMLPEVLLQKRPVSAKRIDGTYREDYRDDGKHVKDRRYPVMFLGTNEFSWEVNTSLQTLDLDAVKKEVEAGNNTKKSKTLWDAYEIAAQGNDLEYFKNMLQEHEQAMQVDQEEKDEAVTKKKEKGKRKSNAVEDSEDVEMEDDGETKKTKPSKKRKKDAGSEGEPEKTPKQPKLKLNNKAPKDASATKPKKDSKPKKAKAKGESGSAEAEAAAEPEEKPLTEAERREKQEKSVLYLRHRLQKGFLARDQAPKEEEMANMNTYLTDLENVQNLEAETIKKTKVHKVLKAIIKLDSIPKEDEYNFKKRSAALLTDWSGALATDEPAVEVPKATPNGVNHDDEKNDAPTEAIVEPESASNAVEGDTAMTDAKDEPPATSHDILMTDVKNDTSAAKAEGGATESTITDATATA